MNSPIYFLSWSIVEIDYVKISIFKKSTKVKVKLLVWFVKLREYFLSNANQGSVWLQCWKMIREIINFYYKTDKDNSFSVMFFIF